MLKKLQRRALVIAVPAFLAISCAHRVDVRPNKPVGSDLQETLALTNESSKPLTIMPALPGSTAAALTLQPQETTSIKYALRLEDNASAGHEQEVVLLPEKSSPYVTQSAIDLLLRARFGHDPAREIRVRLGKCLFGSSQSATHDLHLKKPPLSGVPALQLCP